MPRLATLARLIVCVLVFVVIVGPHILSLRYGRGRIAAWMPVVFHRVFVRLFGLRVTQSGTPPDPGEPALVLANHVSWLDIIVLGSLRPLSFVAKSEIAGWPVIGTLARLQRTVFIDRARRADTASVNTAVPSVSPAATSSSCSPRAPRATGRGSCRSAPPWWAPPARRSPARAGEGGSACNRWRSPIRAATACP